MIPRQAEILVRILLQAIVIVSERYRKGSSLRDRHSGPMMALKTFVLRHVIKRILQLTRQGWMSMLLLTADVVSQV